MSTRDPEAADGDHGEFIDDAMDSDAAVTPSGPDGATSHSAPAPPKLWWQRRPPSWVIAAAAALVVGLVVGLLVGRGDPAPVADAPATTTPATRSAPPPTVTALTHVAPIQLVIPAIGVDSPLVNLGLNADGTLEVPVDYGKAGWFTGGNYPGDPSGPPGLIAGHVDDYTGPAVFFDLKNLVPGDEVQVVRADNTVAVFVVTATAQYPKDEFPAAEVYAPVPGSELVLITCTGSFDEAARSYLDNFVVRATLNMERSLEESNGRVTAGTAVPAVDQANA